MAKPKLTVASLKPNPRNPRTVSPSKLEMLRKSLEHFGDLSGVIYNETSGQLVGGHQRTEVAHVLGASDIAIEKTYDPPTPRGTTAEGYIELAGERHAFRRVRWDEATEKAANIAANKGAGLFDMPALSEMMEDLKAEDIDLDLTMFNLPEREELLLDAGPDIEVLEPVEEPEGDIEPPQEPKAKKGDVYALGKHRLMCGSSADFNDVERLMDGQKADMIFTDPPYNHGSENKLVASSIRKSYAALKTSAWDHDFAFADVEQNMFAAMAENCSVYVCTSQHLFGDIMTWTRQWADHSGYCVWSKSNPMPSLQKRHYTWSSELIAYATRGKHTFNFPDEGHSLSVWVLAKNRHNDLHPTMKPVDVPSHAIKHSSNPGDLVADFFGGAGSTMMACEQLNRRCCTMEIDPKYVDVICNRWARLTGQEPVLLTQEDVTHA